MNNSYFHLFYLTNISCLVYNMKFLLAHWDNNTEHYWRGTLTNANLKQLIQVVRFM